MTTLPTFTCRMHDGSTLVVEAGWLVGEEGWLCSSASGSVYFVTRDGRVDWKRPDDTWQMDFARCPDLERQQAELEAIIEEAP